MWKVSRPTSPRRAVAVLAVALAAAALVPGVAAAGEADEFVDAINASRAANGLDPLQVYWDLEDDALAHSQLMAATDDLHHNPNLTEVTDGWYALGENVGYGWSVESLHDAFMNSPGHRANILGNYNYVGVGVVRESPTLLWVTVVFMRGPDGLGRYPWEGRFADDDTSVHRADIDKIAEAGITKGCNPPDNTYYCPNDHVTRGQMAAFLRRILALPVAGSDHFDDDGRSIFEADINALAEAGIAFGCTATSYCPDEPLRREEMAELLVRAFGYTNPGGTDFFTDDEASPFEASIDKLKNAGVTKGCNPPDNTAFCPDRLMTRAEMATFLVRAVGL